MKFISKLLSLFAISIVLFLVPVSLSLQSNSHPPSSPQINSEFERSTIENTPLVSLTLNLSVASALTAETCDIDHIGNCFLNAALTFYETLFYMTTQIFVIIFGLLMDTILFFSISSDFYHASGIIEAGWEIIRDFTNIVLIFALLVIAFKLVMGNTNADTKKTFGKTILIALVVNFSLFFTYLFIDASNILAHVFYNKIEVGSLEEGSTPTTGEGDIDSGGINIASYLKEMGVERSVSLSIASQINPQRIINVSNINVNFFIGMVLITGAAVLNVVMIYIFFKIMLLFLGRILGLIILTIVSPLAFASHAIPKMKGLPYVGWDSWFPEMIKLSFMAPVFMFFLWLIVRFITDRGILETLNRPSEHFLLEIVNVYILLILIGGLLLLTLKATSQMAGTVGNMASKAVSAVVGGTVAAGSLALTGGAAGVGMLARGAGAATQFASKGKYGKTLSRIGKNAMAFKADVTKIPGFSLVAGKEATGMISKVTGRSALGHIDSIGQSKGLAGAFGSELGKLQKTKDEAKLKEADEEAKSEKKKAENKHAAKLYQAEMDALKAQQDPQYKQAEKGLVDAKEDLKKAVEEETRLSKEHQKIMADPSATKAEKDALAYEYLNAEQKTNERKLDVEDAEDALHATEGYQKGEIATRKRREQKRAGEDAETASRQKSAAKVAKDNPSLANRILSKDPPKKESLTIDEMKKVIETTEGGGKKP